MIIVSKAFAVARMLSQTHCVSLGPISYVNLNSAAVGNRFFPSVKKVGREPVSRTLPEFSLVRGSVPDLKSVIERQACSKKNFCPSLSGM